MLRVRFNKFPPSVRRISTQAVLAELSISSNGPNPGVYNGKWTGSGPILSSYNPATGKLLSTVQSASPQEVDQTLNNAREAYKLWRTVPAPKRGEVLRKIGHGLREKKDALGALISLEMGKALSEGKGEVQEFVDIVDLAVGLSRSFTGNIYPSERNKHFIAEVPNPLGTVGVITAFNFPAAVLGWNFSLAFVTGNATVWKPAGTTPLVALATNKIIVDVLEKEGYPGALCSLLTGEGDVGQRLVDDKRVDLLSFTGSEERGQLVSQQVASRFGKSLLELGGNNAAIVLPDANIQLALQTILFSALGTAGQRCTTTRRLMIHSSISKPFTESLTKAYQSTFSRIGNPLDSETLIGPLHGKPSVDKYLQAISEIKEQGGEILVGGKVRDMPGELAGGFWVEPTLVFMKDKKAPVMNKETFAPILYVTEFNSLQEAIDQNNLVPQGLSSSLFTRDMSNVFHWIGPEGSDTGIVNVNGSTSGAEIGAPFGGNKSTGWGRESGGDAWKQYCRWSSCTLNWSDEIGLAQGVKFE